MTDHSYTVGPVYFVRNKLFGGSIDVKKKIGISDFISDVAVVKYIPVRSW